ncbi:MAG: adenylosuccinate synthase [Planctomycetes bacterium]|nr:adenylosuccinate synthase [Planctomycetota bacterium]
MPVSCVVGLQWGDEGKGKIVDLLAREAEIVVRFQGGANAGHTVQVGAETFVLHLIPSGILHPRTTCVVSNGVVLDPEVLLGEVDALEQRGVGVQGRLFVSDRAHLVLPHHVAIDRARESRAACPIGTTVRGIGPAYADKAARVGIRAGEVRDLDRFAARLRENTEYANRLLTAVLGALPLDVGATVQRVVDAARRLRPLVTDTTALLHEALATGRRIFLEGAQGVMLDVDFGTYPFVTSSNASVLGVGPGTGLPPRALGEVLGVAKAYATRVGAGPFPTEIVGPLGERLRQAGQEFGSTTGRPRRCGWFDVVAARHGVRLMGVSGLVITKLDALSGLERLPVAVAYRTPAGDTTTVFPAGSAEAAAVEPVYEELPGFVGDLGGVRRLDALPAEARRYLAFLEAKVGVKLRLVSVGKERDQVIHP